MKKIKYDWKITTKKIALSSLSVIIAGLAAVYGNSPYYLAIIPFIEGVTNYVKHKN